MKKQFIDLGGKSFEVEFTEYDITPYEVLFHVTLKSNIDFIKEQGLLINKPTYKSLFKTGLLFFSYPIDYNTSDCFRWNDETYALIVLNAKALKEDGILFYNDYFSAQDQSSKKNHLVCEVDIPSKYITKILQW